MSVGTFPSKKPVEAPISSPFGARVDPVTKKPGSMHKGVDFAVPVGTLIRCGVGGTVTRAEWQNPADPKQGFGLMVVVWTKTSPVGEMVTYYGHLSEVKVKAGQRVKPGDEIGLSGNSGKSTGPHLHYQGELWPSREPLEPEWI